MKYDNTSKKLSICIPVYNRGPIFKLCLLYACEACISYESYIEIVVSDNASELSLEPTVDSIRMLYPQIDIIYNRNETNIGLARNFLKTVDIASGEYCWIIGSDDFLKKNAISTLLYIINNYSDVDFIVCNYDLTVLTESMKNGDVSTASYDYSIINHIAPIDNFSVCELGDLINPLYNNVLLGAIMVGIFKKSHWLKIDMSFHDMNGFNTLVKTYPHCYIYAEAFLDKKSYYCGTPIITVGEGVREWSTQTGNEFWDSYLPVIKFNIFTEMLEKYKNHGLNKKSYYLSAKWVAENVGGLIFPIFWRKYIQKKYINHSDLLSISDNFKKYGLIPHFYIGIFKGLAKFMLQKEL